MRLSVWTVASGLVFIVGLILITMQFFFKGVDYPPERYAEDLRHLSWLFVLISCFMALDQVRDDVKDVGRNVKKVGKKLRKFAASFEDDEIEEDEDDLEFVDSGDMESK